MTRNTKFIIAGVVVLLLGGGVAYYLKSPKEDSSYKSIPVKRGTIIQKVEATGTVSPMNRLEIKPPVAGRVEEILVKEGDDVPKGKVLAWVSSTERAALLDSVRTQGKEEIRKWENLYKATPIMAPIAGTIILKNVETGQSFQNTDAVFVMADKLTVKAQIDETDIARIKLKQKAEITLDAYPDHPIKGEVVKLAYDATLTNNVTTYQVDILPIGPPEFLRSGMTSNVDVEVSRKENVLMIPSIAIQNVEEGATVLTGNPEKPTTVSVSTGLDDGKKIEIVSGLLDTDHILVKQSSGLKKKSASGSPFMPSRPKGGGGPR